MSRIYAALLLLLCSYSVSAQVKQDNILGKLSEECPSGGQPLGPQYPSDLQKAGASGTVFLIVRYDRCGVPTSVTVEKSSGHEMLDGAAIKAAYTWRFKQNSPSAVRVPIRFSLVE